MGPKRRTPLSSHQLVPILRELAATGEIVPITLTLTFRRLGCHATPQPLVLGRPNLVGCGGERCRDRVQRGLSGRPRRRGGSLRKSFFYADFARTLIKQIIVSFRGAVNAAEANSLATYRLATAGSRGSFTAKNATVIKLASAVYQAAKNTVTLTPTKPFSMAKPVQLQVNGLAPLGLKDSFGRLIDGDDNGQPGGNAVAILSRGGVKINAIVDHSTDAHRFPLLDAAAVDALLERMDTIGLARVDRNWDKFDPGLSA